ncbi:DUF2513 domain-containing protein [Methylorubrum thiocyanatum]
MKRNMDLIRDFLLAIEDGLESLQYKQQLPDKPYDGHEVWYHYELLKDHKLIKIRAELLGGQVIFDGMTWEGHDFIDTVRDPKIWKKTKEAASNVGSVGFKALVEIGKGYAKQELVKLGLPI